MGLMVMMRGKPKWSLQVIPDSQLSECLDKGSKMKAGTSSRRILAGIMANPTSFGKFKFAIEQARFYKPKGVPASELPLVQVDKALVNAAALMLEDVSGKVSVEVDPRAAYDTDKLVAKGLQLIALFAEIGVSKDEVLLRMPATWEAIQAARKLELEGYATHLVCMYSYAQAVAAIQAGVSVIQINIGRINDWYDKHPGVIRDPKGPREDMAMALAGYGAPLENPGLPLVRSIYNYCHQKGAKTKIIVSGMRTKNEAISLAGCDYLVIGPQVINALKSSVTLEGYNDGLRASEGRFESFGPSLTPENAAASTIEELKVTEENFNDKIGMMGRDLLQGYVDRLTADAKRLEPLLLNQAGGQE